jgi:cyclic pyranopterin phosphate synthase
VKRKSAPHNAPLHDGGAARYTGGMDKLNHFDADGNAIMVDVSEKAVTERMARACGRIYMQKDTLDVIKSGTAKKGDVLGVARLAGIMAAKRTALLIPLCHPLVFDKCSVDFAVVDDGAPAIEATCTVKLAGKTGAEMEALTGVSVALLTIYDMCKAIDRAMTLSDIRLLEKDGGKSGHFVRSC